MMGLRLTTGIPKSRIAHYAEADFDAILPPDALQPFIAEGLLWANDQAIGATPAGAIKLNALTQTLIKTLQ